LLAEICHTGHSADSVIVPMLGVEESPLQLFFGSSLPLSHSPSTPEPLHESGTDPLNRLHN
jgi:hypothetical protein